MRVLPFLQSVQDYMCDRFVFQDLWTTCLQVVQRHSFRCTFCNFQEYGSLCLEGCCSVHIGAGIDRPCLKELVAWA